MTMVGTLVKRYLIFRLAFDDNLVLEKSSVAYLGLFKTPQFMSTFVSNQGLRSRSVAPICIQSSGFW